MLARIGTALAAALLCLGALACGDSADTAASSSSGGAGGATSSSATSGSATSASTGTGSGGDAEWTLVPWATPGCVVEYAKKPELAFPKLEWEPCPGGEAGCERIKKNWPYEFESAFAPPGIRTMSEGWEVSMFVQYPDDETRRAVIGANGVATAAYRYLAGNGDCLAAGNGISAEGHWVGMKHLGVAEPGRYVFQPRGAPVEQAEIVPTTQLAQYQRGGEELLALQLDFGTGWLVYDRLTKVLHAPPPNFTAAEPRLVGGSVFWLHYPDLNKPEAWVFTRSGGFSQLIDRNPGHVLAVQADGVDLVWIESPPTPTPGAWPIAGTLMRSPFATTAAEVTGSAVRAMPPLAPGMSGALGDGYFAIGSTDTENLVVRLSDGVLWTVNLPAQDGSYLHGINHLDATYLFFKSKHHIYRQRLDQLGPGQPAN